MFENIGLSFQGIWAHKMRSFLTMLGIIIGIAAIIAIVSTINGTNEQIKQNLIGSGNNAVEVSLFQDDWQYEMQYNGIPEGVPVLTEKDREKILGFDEVEAAAFYHRRNSPSVFRGSTSLNGGNLMGTDNNYLKVYGYTVREGRSFSQEDLTGYKKVVLLDDQAAKTLFPSENPLGKTLEIQGEPFVVIGVAVQSSSFQPVINSIEDYYTYMGNETSGNLYIPYTCWPILFQYDEPQNVVVRAISTDDMTQAGKKTADYLNEQVKNSNNIKYKSSDLLEQAKNLQELSSSTNQMLIWIASISLLVGGIGVMNIMLVSVTERTREIGLKKALGAPKSRILGQFLTEAAVLTSLGGLLGVLAGIGLAHLVSRMAEIPIAISFPAAGIAVVFSMLIGIIFGILPSVKAANLNPIDALRHE